MEEEKKGMFRKILRIRAVDSPNVKLALEEIAAGREPSHRNLVPGVLTYKQYLERRATWPEERQCVGLDAEFYEGASTMLVPAQWLVDAANFADDLERSKQKRIARAMGVDGAGGGDNTVYTVVDEYGILEVVSKKTKDTSVIVGEVVALGMKYNLPPSQWVFDAGGGGNVHADRLRMMGKKVRTVSFGESATVNLQAARTSLTEKQEVKDAKRAYRNRRAEMYGDLRLLLDPSTITSGVPVPMYRDKPFCGFGIPQKEQELRRQLSLMPVFYDEEGRMYLPSKDKKSRSSPNELTLKQIIGNSPDEADSLVLAVFGMLRSTPTFIVRSMF